MGWQFRRFGRAVAVRAGPPCLLIPNWRAPSTSWPQHDARGKGCLPISLPEGLMLCVRRSQIGSRPGIAQHWLLICSGITRSWMSIVAARQRCLKDQPDCQPHSTARALPELKI